MEPTTVAAVTVEDARRAGFPSKAAMLKAFPRKLGSRLYRVEFALAGPDPRIALRERAELDEDDRKAITTRLERMDRSLPRAVDGRTLRADRGEARDPRWGPRRRALP